jgi:virginiamycin B lyase
VSKKHVFAGLVAAASMAVGLGAVGAGAEGPPPCESDCATHVAQLDGSGPFGVTQGPRGSMYLGIGHDVVRIDQQGETTSYPVSSADEQDVGWLTTGPDGAVWFCERDTGKIGRLGANGSMREYALPSPDAGPQGIVFAPDGNIYVTEQGSNAIARVNPTTGAAVDIPVPTPDSTTQSGALGPDGAIWFIERSADKVGRMTLDGKFTEYKLADNSFPNRIVVGPDGALWFSELRANKIGRLTTSGHLTEYPADGPVGITVGKDGQFYIVSYADAALLRMNVNGEVTGSWPLPGAGGPLQVSPGFGLDVWVTDTFGNQVYRVTPYGTGRWHGGA